MKKNILILILSFGSTLLFASERPFEGFPEIRFWDLKVSPDVYTPENLWDYINGGADLYIKYGFTKLHLAEYSTADGITVQAEIYQHNSEINAYGIYATERSPEYQFIKLGGQAYIGDGFLNFFNGNCYVKLFTSEEGSSGSRVLKKVATSIVKAMGQKSDLPEEFSVFPKKQRVSYTDKFTAKQYLGNHFLNNVYSADYEDGYTLFLIESTNLNEISKIVSSYLEFTKQNLDPAENSIFIIKDPYNGDIPSVIFGRYLLGILNGAASQSAKENLEILMKNVHAL